MLIKENLLLAFFIYSLLITIIKFLLAKYNYIDEKILGGCSDGKL